MPWEIKTGLAGCTGYAITKKGESEVLYCHDSRLDAEKQLSALYASEPEAYAKSLTDDVLIKAHNVTHGQKLSSAIVQLHHVIVGEMRKRGIAHENVDCQLHKAAVLKSELVVSAEKAARILKGQPTSTQVHVDTIMGGKKKKKKKEEDLEKYDKPGHPFRGNQWTRGGGGGVGQSRPVASSKIEASKEATAESKLQAEAAIADLKETIASHPLPQNRDAIRHAAQMKRDTMQAESMAQSGFGIQEDRLAGANGRSMASGKVARNDYANRMETYADDIELSANAYKEVVYRISSDVDVVDFMDDIEMSLANLRDAARNLRRQP